jgi:hypothetical protein
VHPTLRIGSSGSSMKRLKKVTRIQEKRDRNFPEEEEKRKRRLKIERNEKVENEKVQYNCIKGAEIFSSHSTTHSYTASLEGTPSLFTDIGILLSFIFFQVRR